MVRSLRLIEPNLWHHTMNRGQNGREIFLDDEDRERFLDLVGDCGKRWNVWVNAYCLMSNHYHLLLHDEDGRLDRAMRHIDGVYTQWFNRKYRRDGALMRGRYRSRVVQSERYLVEVVRYLHMNPVDAGLAERAGDYEWSSHRGYLGHEDIGWLRLEEVLDLLGLELGAHGRDFDAFVHEAVDNAMGVQVRVDRWSPILGDESFIDSCRQFVRERPQLTDPEIADGRRLAALDVEDVIDAACETFELERSQLLQGKRGSRNIPRLVTLQVCRDRTPTPGKVIAMLFGVRPGTVADLARRARSLTRENIAAAQCLAQLEEQIAKRTCQSTT